MRGILAFLTSAALATLVACSSSPNCCATPPMVVSTTPLSGATNVAVTSTLMVVFDEAMDCSSITSSTFFETVGGVQTTGTIACAGMQAIFTPASSLSPGATYAATVVAGVKNQSGVALPQSVTWSFTTSTGGGTPPTVVSTSPANGATGVAVTSALTVNFSEAMDCTTMTSSTFFETMAAGHTAGNISCAGTVATFTPLSSLSPSATYSATVLAGVKSQSGLALASSVTWSFGTAAAAACGGDSGKIYVADFGNRRLVRVDDMCGDNWTTLSQVYLGAALTQFDEEGLFVDSNGAVYVADTFNNRIIRMDDFTGANAVSYSGPNTSPFSAPRSVFVARGHIYVTDGFSFPRIVQMDDMTGKNWTTYPPASASTNPFNALWGLYVTSNYIYVTNNDTTNLTVAQVVRMNDISGAGFTTFGTVGTGTKQFKVPWGISVDGSGRIYVVDGGGNGRIARMDDMTGANWTTLGTFGDQTDQFADPFGVFVDGTGRIYVADFSTGGFANGNRIVRVDDMTGTNWTTLGTLGAGIKQFTSPTSIWVH